MAEKNFIFLVGSLESGGTENYLLRFLEYSKDNTDPRIKSITVISKSGKAGALEQSYRETGASIKFLKLGYFNLPAIFKLYKQFKLNDCVICDLTGNFAGLPMLIGKMASVKNRISFYRASSNHFKPNPFKDWYNNTINSWVYKYSTSILSNSHAAFEYFFAGRFESDQRFKVIKNGVSTSKFTEKYNKIEVRKKYGIPDPAKVIGHVGRVNAAKNFETMLEVASIVIRKNPEVHFVFCGRGTDQSKFQKKLQELGILENCHGLGQQSNVAEVLNAYDLFYFPSVTEGQPNALIEAMMSGLPFVASNIDAIKECLPKEAEQYLIPPKASKESADLILATLNMSEPLILQEWAMQEYDASRRFEDFKKVLLTDIS